MKALQTAGLKNVETKLDWKGTMDRLGTALNLAFESKRIDGKLKGHLIEMGPGEWFLTGSGIVQLEHGIVVTTAEFPPPFERVLGVVGAMASGMKFEKFEADLKKFEERPGWADPDEWNYIVSRARAVFPGVNTKHANHPPALASLVPPKRPEPTRPAPPNLHGH